MSTFGKGTNELEAISIGNQQRSGGLLIINNHNHNLHSEREKKTFNSQEELSSHVAQNKKRNLMANF